jgi:sialic acid synthase SpsE/sugar phosphate isomerase/epimerase
MKINKNISDFVLSESDKLQKAIEIINSNKSKISFVVDDYKKLIGSLSDGDIRRYLTSSTEINLEVSVDKLMNRNVKSFSIKDFHISKLKYVNDGIQIIPLIDESSRLIAIFDRINNDFSISGRKIGDQYPSFIIAEIGNNHQGDIGLAKEMVNLAINAGADCVKFQMRNLRAVYGENFENDLSKLDLGTQYTYDLLLKYQLKDSELLQVFDYVKELNTIPLCTPWDEKSLRILEEYGMPCYKVSSADFTNFQLLERLCDTGKPLICSTGMSTESEILSSVNFMSSRGVEFSLLHCNSTYPTPFKDVNLRYLDRLKNLSGNRIIGYSGHERGIEVPIAAVARGAKIIEKHFTLDRNLEGNDHKVSLLPKEFSSMVKMIRNVETSLGKEEERRLTQGELINRENLAKSLVINQNLKKGDVIERYMVDVVSPGKGIQPNRLNKLVGKKANRDFIKGDLFFETDILTRTAKQKEYNFKRPFGIPVRYHDFDRLTKDIDLDFVEFHLSYKDLDLDLKSIFNRSWDRLNFSVHCPELFSGDHLLDLANENLEYRRRSISELKRTVEISKNLRNYFPITEKPKMIINAGGWSKTGFVDKSLKKSMYGAVADSLQQVDLNDIDIIIQTMPPFPWHFGGQSYHNLFVEPQEISKFCMDTGFKMCLDVSHSFMACNFLDIRFSDFLDVVLPFTTYLHIADGSGVDLEGIQIGEGDVDFRLLNKKLSDYCPNVPFIPEVWQGHNNDGEGFWHALDFLQKEGY